MKERTLFPGSAIRLDTDATGGSENRKRRRPTAAGRCAGGSRANAAANSTRGRAAPFHETFQRCRHKATFQSSPALSQGSPAPRQTPPVARARGEGAGSGPPGSVLFLSPFLVPRPASYGPSGVQPGSSNPEFVPEVRGGR